MAKFLNTSATNYYLEELIRTSKERLVLISPYLKLNDRIKELLLDKNRLKIDVRIVYGKIERQSNEMEWLRNLSSVQVSFLKNLHAKCYLNEEMCIISSLNLYEFSQVNNNEMGVLIRQAEDGELYWDAYEEAQRLIRVSAIGDSGKVEPKASPVVEKHARVPRSEPKEELQSKPEKITTSKLAKKLGIQTNEANEWLVGQGLLEKREDKFYLTAKGKEVGGEFRMSQKFGAYFLWPHDLER